MSVRRRRRRPEPDAGARPRRLFPDPLAAVTDRTGAALRDLMVLTSDEDLVRWNRRRIAEVLVRETGLEPRRAEAISRRIEEQLVRANLQAVSTALLRELVGAELVAEGLTSAWSRHARLGVSLYDAGRMMRGPEPDEAGEAGAIDPEATSLELGGRIKREYALAAVFSPPVADAHRRGSLHVHDLDAVDRPESLWLTLEGLGRRGLGGAIGPAARPARDAEALCGQIARLASTLLVHLSGGVGFESLNFTLAPYLAGRSAAELRQAAGLLLEEIARTGAPRRRAGRAAVAATIEWELPDRLARSPAVGPGGEEAGSYGAQLALARRVAVALLEATCERDAERSAWPSPELTLVIGPGFFRAPDHLALLELAAEAARQRGTPRFRFVRPGEAGDEEAVGERAGARRGRRAVLSTVSIDLPRLGYLAGRDEEAIEARLYALLEAAARAHIEKRVFLEDLLARGRSGPLGSLADPALGGGEPLLKVDEALHLIAPCGLNELVEMAAGAPLHASEEALAAGERTLERMARHAHALARKHKLRFTVGGSGSLAVASRFAKLDLRYHAPLAGHHVKGDLGAGGVRYTPGVALEMETALPPLKRLRAEGRLHALAPGEALSVAPAACLGRSARAAAAFVMEVYLNTGCRELRFSG